jgi:DNA invertase Pin-like site-specific DNA recombinase
MKVALYCRVSTRRQTNENQELILTEYAKRSNWDYEIFNEVESSRGTRPVKQDLLRRLRLKEFDIVCVLKLDRWGRSVIELALEIQELYEKGIAFISLRDNIDLTTATGKLQFTIISAFAEFERDLIRERTLDGLARARVEGKTLGRPVGRKDGKIRRKSGYVERWSLRKEKYPPAKTPVSTRNISEVNKHPIIQDRMVDKI